jgi:hypothetical protein
MTAVLNEPSQAVMRRLGMTPYAHFDHPRIAPGNPLRPHVAYRLGRPGARSPAAARTEPAAARTEPAAARGEE